MSPSPLENWLRHQKRGALTRLMHETKLAWSTVCRAKRGERVGLKAAVLISRATRGEVAESVLMRADEDDASRAA